MIGKVLKTDVFYEFKIGETTYTYINLPIEIDCGTDKGKGFTVSHSSNFLSPGKQLSELKQLIVSIAEAFNFVNYWKHQEAGYVYGVVKDYESQSMYYDNDQALEVMNERRPEEFAFFENKIKVEDWSNAEKYVNK